MRDSTSLKMIPYLCKKGAKVNYYDPSGEKKEFRKIKQKKVSPKMFFDYVNSGSWTETTYNENVSDFKRLN